MATITLSTINWGQLLATGGAAAVGVLTIVSQTATPGNPVLAVIPPQYSGWVLLAGVVATGILAATGHHIGTVQSAQLAATLSAASSSAGK